MVPACRGNIPCAGIFFVTNYVTRHSIVSYLNNILCYAA